MQHELVNKTIPLDQVKLTGLSVIESRCSVNPRFLTELQEAYEFHRASPTRRIGIDENNGLVFGYDRYLKLKDSGATEIDVLVIPIHALASTLAIGIRDNSDVVDTIDPSGMWWSERVEITEAVSSILDYRRGLPRVGVHVAKFTNYSELGQARLWLRETGPEGIAVIDAKNWSIYRGYKFREISEEDQRRIARGEVLVRGKEPSGIPRRGRPKFQSLTAMKSKPKTKTEHKPRVRETPPELLAAADSFLETAKRKLETYTSGNTNGMKHFDLEDAQRKLKLAANLVRQVRQSLDNTVA